ncbi:MAG: hypothetical protein V1660_02010 [archaeon]
MEERKIFEFKGIGGRRDKCREMTGEMIGGKPEFNDFYSIFYPAKMFFYGNERIIFQMYELSDCPAWVEIIVPGYVRSGEFENYEEYFDFGKTLGDEKFDLRDITSILVEPVKKEDQGGVKRKLMDLIKEDLQPSREYKVNFWEIKKDEKRIDYLDAAKKCLEKFREITRGRFK